MHTVEITLEQVLLARDRRVLRQRELAARYGGTLLSFTMNIAGPVKDAPLVRLAFQAGLAALDRDLGKPVHRELIQAPTGPEALLVYDCPAPWVKERCLLLEEREAVGRLYDLDVLSPEGEKLSRPQSRRCLICGGPVTVCSRSRAHGLPAIRARTRDILADFAAGHLSALARQALEDEVDLTPKPGLVDRRNTGAHDDMDLPLFRRSAAALEPYFCRFVSLGMAGASPAELQALGREAEHAMLTATGGVNTHKGALYSFSLLLAAAGRRLCAGGDLFETVRRLAEQLQPPRQTHGVQVLQQYRVGGARAEALAGFPTAQRAASLLTDNDPLTVLLWLMAHVEDSNVYYRGGADAAAMVHRSAAAILEAPPAQRVSLTAALDEQLIAHRISPGGCADLLALALLLQRLHGLIA